VPTDIEFTVSSVVHGQTFSVSVQSSPCNSVCIRFFVDGVVVDEVEDHDVAGACVLACPETAQGKPWRVEVECNPDGEPSDERVGCVG
jgi:hypothetical protein